MGNPQRHNYVLMAITEGQVLIQSKVLLRVTDEELQNAFMQFQRDNHDCAHCIFLNERELDGINTKIRAYRANQ